MMLWNEFPLLLTIWGAILSTGLAIIKVWEIWQQRLRLTTNYVFASDPEHGNEIIIENASMVPVMISYWELLWIKRRWMRTSVTGGEFPDEGYCNITIGPHSRHVLHFRNEHHFTWECRAASKGKLFLKLFVVGRRRPIRLQVYDPDM